MAHSVYFTRTYAAAPISNVSLVAMLTSTGPPASYKLVTLDYPRARLTTLYERLKSRGFVTGFFWSNDSEFLGINNFLQDRGIDLNQDYRHRHCPESRTLVKGEPSLPYVFSADICTASSLLNWIDDSRGKPFFATLWTEQTHYPYAASGSCMSAVAAKGKVIRPKAMRFEEEWLRYAGALCDADRMMAKIVSGLQERNLLKDTLMIVVGDHGEGFGQHNSYIHGPEIYESDIRVPLLISAGHALTGTVDGRLASHLDIAPTITAAFEIPPGGAWEGNDLFDNRAPRRVYFYTFWGNYKFGYREANNKYIYDAVQRKLFAYDLASDPGETVNIAGKNPTADAEALRQIKNWYLQRVKFGNRLR